MRFLPSPHSTPQPTPRPARRRAPDPAARATVHVRCGIENEAKVRALCVLGLKPGTHLLGLRTSQDHDDTVRIWVTLSVEGPAGVLLEQLISRLSAEPDVRDLHWRVHSGPAPRKARGRRREEAAA
ncbi:hypothetical protein [Streptomyces abikoensis]|uniref:hypothetical protein n=1 Tax=Streptomyces abikoensis TaxID=97398 RepID=UPI0033C70E97